MLTDWKGKAKGWGAGVSEEEEEEEVVEEVEIYAAVKELGRERFLGLWVVKKPDGGRERMKAREVSVEARCLSQGPPDIGEVALRGCL